MAIVYDYENIVVHHAEALETLRAMPDHSVHSVVCDPQYGLSNVSTKDTVAAITAWVSGNREQVPIGRGFMGNEWDAFVPPPAIWDECYRVLMPGGHLLAFAGTRTADLAGISIRLAGFEIRDSIDCIGHRLSWYHGQGFPKSTDVSKAFDDAFGAEREVIRPRSYDLRNDGGYSGGLNTTAPRSQSCEISVPTTDEAKQWNGWGTALKPAHEPIIVARKPLVGRVIDNVYDYGTGALNIDGCRAAWPNGLPCIGTPEWGGPNKTLSATPGTVGAPTVTRMGPNKNGRWPPNVALNHPPLFDQDTGEILGDACANGCVEGCAVAELDRQSGELHTQDPKTRNLLYNTGWSPAGTERPMVNKSECLVGSHDERGTGASRFFPQFRWQAKASGRERPKVDNVMHPTVKPLALVRWLVRLVTPPNGIVLDWCTGSGTTAEAALLEGLQAIVIEREDEYIPLILSRLESPLYDSEVT